jgi:maltokinase-like protein
MAVIHHTTLKPTKLELVTAWLPTRAWFAGAGRTPEFSKAGGFRLDDPEGEVGIEFMVLTDTSGERPVTYHVPLSYRGAPLDGADDGLVGTLEHGVLGKRWVYDGAHDPVVVEQALALLQGRAEAQTQSETDTPDRSVAGHFTGAGFATGVGALTTSDDPDGTRVTVETAAESGAGASGGPSARVELRIRRVLVPEEAAGEAEADGHITAEWQLPGGGTGRGRFAVLDAVGELPAR